MDIKRAAVVASILDTATVNLPMTMHSTNVVTRLVSYATLALKHHGTIPGVVLPIVRAIAKTNFYGHPSVVELQDLLFYVCNSNLEDKVLTGYTLAASCHLVHVIGAQESYYGHFPHEHALDITDQNVRAVPFMIFLHNVTARGVLNQRARYDEPDVLPEETARAFVTALCCITPLLHLGYYEDQRHALLMSFAVGVHVLGSVQHTACPVPGLARLVRRGVLPFFDFPTSAETTPNLLRTATLAVQLLKRYRDDAALDVHLAFEIVLAVVRFSMRSGTFQFFDGAVDVVFPLLRAHCGAHSSFIACISDDCPILEFLVGTAVETAQDLFAPSLSLLYSFFVHCDGAIVPDDPSFFVVDVLATSARRAVPSNVVCLYVVRIVSFCLQNCPAACVAVSQRRLLDELMRLALAHVTDVDVRDASTTALVHVIAKGDALLVASVLRNAFISLALSADTRAFWLVLRCKCATMLSKFPTCCSIGVFKADVYGDCLFDMVAAFQPDLASKVTGMLLEALTHVELCDLLSNAADLRFRVKEATDCIREWTRASAS